MNIGRNQERQGISSTTNQKQSRALGSKVLILISVFTFLGVALAITVTIATAQPTGGNTPTDLGLETQNPNQVDILIDESEIEGVVEAMIIFPQHNTNKVAHHNRGRGISSLKNQASNSQAPINTLANHRADTTVKNNHWITNAALIQINTSTSNLSMIAKLKGVKEIHPNYEIRLEETTEETNTSLPASTWGVERVKAPEAWSAHKSMGDGVRVGVIDTGVNASHQDINLYTNNTSDPTYPGGWVEIDKYGNIVKGTTPYDSDGHGTHVSGTAVGGNASGEYIGVAPNASLMHALALPGGTGSSSSVITGIEWMVENNADILSMSFGSCDVFSDSLADATWNARQMGVTPISAAGNCGDGSTSSPGNSPDDIGIGAIKDNNNVPTFSSGQEITTSDEWFSTAIKDHWPDFYIKPDITAPGVNIKSATRSGGYTTKRGTSMATPHIAGVAALIQASTDSYLSPSSIEQYLIESAWKPADKPDGKDTRYGYGIVDAYNATLIASQSENGDPTVNVSIDGVNTEAEIGEDILVNVSASNTGEYAGNTYISIDVSSNTSGEIIYSNRTETFLLPGETIETQYMWNTTDADEYIMNASSNSSNDQKSINVSMPEAIMVSLTAINDGLEAGSELKVELNVTNTYKDAANPLITLDIEGDQEIQEVDQAKPKLESGETQSIWLRWDTNETDHGTYKANVSSKDDYFLAEFNVTENKSSLNVEVEGTNNPIVGGDTLVVTSNITNNGGVDKEQNVSMEVNGEYLTEQAVYLKAGESTKLNMSWETTVYEGEEDYVMTVQSGELNDSINATIRLKPVTSSLASPQDLNNDGVYRDVDGDGDFTANDVQVFFDERRHSDVIDAHQGRFNMNSDPDSRVTIGDVQALHLALRSR